MTVDTKQKITCPKCNAEFSVDDIITSKIEAKIRQEFEEKEKIKEEVLRKKEEELTNKTKALQEMQANTEVAIASQVSSKLAEEKVKLSKNLREEVEKEQKSKTDWLEEQLKGKDTKLEEARSKELALLQEQSRLKEEKASFELEKTRQLEEAKIKLAEEAKTKATEEQQYVIAQLKKQLTDATKAKDELARKLEQGSQQTQGEVLELELEDMLKSAFIYDTISPVPKGISGADIIQQVYNKSNNVCGQIIWESKKTKSWSDSWIQKLKDDQRTIKADIAVIVSFVLPEDVKGYAFRDGIWICDVKMAIALATSLRMTLEAISREKMMSVGKNEKMDLLYSYLTGVEFKQRVEAIVEAFSSMQEGLIKERNAYEKIWAEREKQIMKVIRNTNGMYGDLSGLVTLPQINPLELKADEKE